MQIIISSKAKNFNTLDSAISSLADDLERRVMLELERKADSQRRENDLAGSAVSRSSGRRRSSFKFKKSESDREKIAPTRNFSSSSSGSTSGANQVASYRIRHGLSTTESSGYSSINITDDFSKFSDSTPSENKSKSKRNFAQFVKTNPVARKLKLLAPGDSYSDLDSRLRVAKWYHQGLPKWVINFKFFNGL